MKWIDRTLVASPYFVCLCLTEKDFHKALKKLHLPVADWPNFLKGGNATVHFLVQKGGLDLVALVCMPESDHPRVSTYALLVHEAVHIWQAIKEAQGEKTPSDEYEAYSIQTLSQRLMEAYDEQVSQPAPKGKPRRK